VKAWAALRPASVETRNCTLRVQGTAKDQVVMLSGEAGIGKSRLTAALFERLASEPHTRLRYFCSPQHTDSAFYPITGQMKRAAALPATTARN
jgi:predicted ATPase